MKRKFTLQYAVYILLFLAFVYALYAYRSQLTETADVIVHGTWYLVLSAFVVLALVVYNQAALYSEIYDIFSLPQDKKRLLSLYLVTRFVMVAAPSGGVSGWVPFIQDAHRRDLGVGKVLIANLVYMILWYSAVSVFLIGGMIHLFLVHDLEWFEISAAITLLVLDLVMITGVILAGVAPGTLHTILSVIRKIGEKVTGWLNRKPRLREHHIDTFVDDLHESAIHMKRVGFRRLLRPILHAMLNEVLNLGILYILAVAFGIHLSFGVLVAAYSISILFYIISPTPGGLGFVEGSMVLVLGSLGMRTADATILTLAYRGVTFWIPFVMGFIALRWTSQSPATS